MQRKRKGRGEENGEDEGEEKRKRGGWEKRKTKRQLREENIPVP